MIMATALNMSWKLPVAYFLIPDGFSAEKREELLRTCVYHLNNTGAILTSIVMDNCPVNYATFRKLGCNLSRKFCDLNPATDMKNVSGKYVMALFDPPHLSKLGICFIVQVSHQTYSDAEFFECCVLLKITGAQPWPRINRLKFFQIWFWFCRDIQILKWYCRLKLRGVHHTLESSASNFSKNSAVCITSRVKLHTAESELKSLWFSGCF